MKILYKNINIPLLTCSILFTVFCIDFGFAQKTQGIGTNKPHPRAVLELKVEDAANYPQGFLLPKLSTSERLLLNTVAGLPSGMSVYDTDDKAFYIWDGTSWKSSGSLVSIAGISGVNVNQNGQAFTITGTSNHWISSSGNQIYTNSFVGIGTSNPKANFDITNAGNTGMVISATGAGNEGYITISGLGSQQIYFEKPLSGIQWKIGREPGSDDFRIGNLANNYLNITTSNDFILSNLNSFYINNNFQVDVNGNIVKINGAATNFPNTIGGANTFLRNDGSGILNWVSIPTSQWISSSGNQIYTNSFVGIGLSTPNALLQFPNTNSNRKIVLHQDVNNDYENYGFGITTGTLMYTVGSTSGRHTFYAGTSSATNTELMSIQGDGNVLIGIGIPNQKLTVQGNSSVAGIGYFGTIIGNNLTGAAGSIVTVDGVGRLGIGSMPSSTSQWTTTTNGVYYNGGNVGIGTNANAAFGIDMLKNMARIRRVSDAAGQNAEFDLSDNAETFTWRFGLRPSDQNNNFNIGYFSGSYNVRMYIDPTTGNTGFGNFSSIPPVPNQRLVVFGNSSVTGTGFFGTIIGNNLAGAAGSIVTVDGVGRLGIGTFSNFSSQWISSASDKIYTNSFVGIGTNNPTAPLEVVGNPIIRTQGGSWNDGINLIASSSTSKGLIFHEGSGMPDATTGRFFLGIVGSNPVFNFIGNGISSSIFTEQNAIAIMNTLSGGTFAVNGRIGIGIENPTAKLDVAGNARISGPLTLVGLSSGIANLGINANGEVITVNSAVSQWITNGSDIYYNSGNVGIGAGATTPAEQLVVDGNIQIGAHDIILTDKNHGFGWYGLPGRAFAGQDINGPVLYGNSGGALGINNAFTSLDVSLIWQRLGVGDNRVSINNPNKADVTATLDVNGNARIRNLSVAGALLTVDGLGNIGIGTMPSGTSQWVTTTSGNIYFPGNRIGIGTDPQHDLHIYNQAGGPYVRLQTPFTGLLFSAIEFQTGIYDAASPTDRTDAIWQIGFVQQGTVSAPEDRIYFGRSGLSSTDMGIYRDGNVGIGIINTWFPNERLTVQGNASITGIGYFSSISGLALNGAAAGSVVTVDGAGKLGFGAYPSSTTQWTTSATDLYYNSGNVAIGSTFTTNSSMPTLLVTGDRTTIAPDQIVVGGAGVNNDKQLLIGYNTTGNYGVIQSVQQLVSVTPLILQSNGGNVGVGTTNPNERLTVQGNASITGIGYFSSISGLALNGAAAGSVVTVDGAGKLGFGTLNNSSQWNTLGSDIYYTTGSVGIGTPAPSSFIANDVFKNVGAPVNNSLYYGSRSIANISTTAVDVTAVGIAGIAQTNDDVNIGVKGDANALAGVNYGGYFSASGGGTNNVGAYFSAIGGTNNYAAIFEGGNVGIGISSPTSNLHINGASNTDIKSEAAAGFASVSALAGSTSISMFAEASGTGGIGTNSNEDFYFRTNLIERVRISANGNVGIGTTIPSAKLEVNGDVKISSSLTLSGLSGGQANLGVNANGEVVTVASNVSQWQNSGADISYNSGNVGIGISTPDNAAFYVNNLVNSNYARFGTDFSFIQGTSIGFRSYYNGGYRFSQGGSYAGTIGFDGSNGNFEIRSSSIAGGSTGDLASMNLSLLIAGNGNIGIGTNAPKGKLDVIGDVHIQTALTVAGLAGFNGSVVTVDGAGRLGIGYISSANNYWLVSNPNNIYTNSFVGIGKSNPTEILDVLSPTSIAGQFTGTSASSPAILRIQNAGAGGAAVAIASGSEFGAFGVNSALQHFMYSGTSNKEYLNYVPTTEKLTLGNSSGNLVINTSATGIGTNAFTGNEALRISSYGGMKGFVLPYVTTAQMVALSVAGLSMADQGMLFWNTNSKDVAVWDGNSFSSKGQDENNNTFSGFNTSAWQLGGNTVTGFPFVTTTGYAKIGINEKYNLAFVTDNVVRMYVSSAGGIGINNNNNEPAAALQVNGDIGLGDGTSFNNKAVTIFLKNVSGSPRVVGEIVIISPTPGAANDDGFTVTNIAGNNSAVGVLTEACPNNSVCKVAISGVVNVIADVATVRGQHVITGSTTSGRAGSTPTPNPGASIGIWLQDGIVAGGLARVLLK